MADDPMTGVTATCQHVAAANLARLLDSLARAEGWWGLAWRLDRIVWLEGAGGQVKIFYATGPNQAQAAGPVPATGILKDYPAGRIFNERSEWRWHRDGETTFTILGLAEDPPVLHAGLQALSGAGEAVAAEIRDGWQVAHTTWRLTGSIADEDERTRGPLARQTWFETRYPVPLVYPVARTRERRGQPRLDVCSYADGNGAVRFVRFRRIHVEGVAA